MTDERRQYRTLPLYEGHLSVAVVQPGEEGLPGQIVDLSIGGASILLHHETDPGLQAGDKVYLHLESPHLTEELVTLGAVRRRTEGKEGVTYGVEFLDWLGILPRLPEEVKALFNQRNEYRVGLGPHHPLEVLGVEPVFKVAGILHNISPEGLCFHVPVEGDGLFIPGSPIQVAFRLPGDGETLTFDAKILHANGYGNRLYCGVLFDRETTPDFPQKQLRITAYAADAVRRARDVPTPECPPVE